MLYKAKIGYTDSLTGNINGRSNTEAGGSIFSELENFTQVVDSTNTVLKMKNMEIKFNKFQVEEIKKIKNDFEFELVVGEYYYIDGSLEIEMMNIMKVERYIVIPDHDDIRNTKDLPKTDWEENPEFSYVPVKRRYYYTETFSKFISAPYEQAIVANIPFINGIVAYLFYLPKKPIVTFDLNNLRERRKEPIKLVLSPSKADKSGKFYEWIAQFFTSNNRKYVTGVEGVDWFD